jgi:hypothetical protein
MNELNVKAGDKVIFNPSGTYSKPRIEIVEKVTPIGRIKVCGSYFSKSGYQIGGETWYRCSISEATEERIKEITQAEFIRTVMYRLSNLKSLTYEQAVAIGNILNGGD